jgi:hypothetical protein
MHSGSAQEMFTGKKGSRLFPGHWHSVIIVNDEHVHYQLFNHWYSRAYAQLRDTIIPLNEVVSFNKDKSTKSTIMLSISKKKIRLIDDVYGIKHSLKRKKLCADLDTMRKISFAYEYSKKNENVHFQELYTQAELELGEEEFKIVVQRNFQNKTQ